MITFVFLHGSFHAAWNWHKVLPLLGRLGYRGVALDLPGHGRSNAPPSSVTLAACVEKVVEAIDAIEGDVVLVAHSRNGIVISQAAEERPGRIRTLVYLAAYLVPDGKAMMDYAVLDGESLVLRNVEPPFDRRRVEALLRITRSALARRLLPLLLPQSLQSHSLKKEAFTEALYHDCPPEITELANVLLEAESNWPGFTPLRLSRQRYGRVRKVYVECTGDRAVTLPLQRRMQEDSPCDRVISLEGGHSPFFAQPGVLVDALLDAVCGHRNDAAEPEAA
jgi:pimeloyl-ACP methyl ester carboxylesterase